MRASQKETEWYLPISIATEMLGCHFKEVYALVEKQLLGCILMPQGKIKISEESIRRFMGQAT